MPARTLPAARRVASLLTAALALALGGGAARAQDGPSATTGRIAETPLPKLEVQRAEGAEACVDALGLAEDLQGMVGRPAVDVEPGPGDGYRIDIARAPEGFEALVRRRGEASGERRIVDPDPTCQGLRETVSLALAVILDEPPRTAEGPGPPRIPFIPPPPPPEPPAPAGPPMHLGFSVGALATYELLDSLWPALFAEVALEPLPSFSLAGGVLWTPGEEIASGTGDIQVALLAGILRGCNHVRLAAPRVSGCLDLALGDLLGEGVGYQGEGNAVAHRFWMVGGASLEASGPIYGPIGWTARGGVWVPFRHQSFTAVAANQATLSGRYDTSSVAGILGGGLRLSIF